MADWREESMEYFMVPAQKVPSLQHFRKTEKEVIGGLCSLANIPLTPETARDQERRIRREIANSNERRRMQSINSGFQSLKTLIPHSDGEKLSKVSKVGHGRGPIELGGYQTLQTTLKVRVTRPSAEANPQHLPLCASDAFPG
uniref:Transcription factor AP-4 n=1 Tax=Gasterosteus aculeatus aculeatus TaxID=481459 RepID=A0AAQ4R6V2_GASAC